MQRKELEHMLLEAEQKLSRISSFSLSVLWSAFLVAVPVVVVEVLKLSCPLLSKASNLISHLLILVIVIFLWAKAKKEYKVLTGVVLSLRQQVEDIKTRKNEESPSNACCAGRLLPSDKKETP